MYEAGVQRNEEPAQPVQPVRPRQVKTLTVLLVVFGALGMVVAFLLLSIVSDSADHGQSVPAVLYLLSYAQLALSAMLAICGAFVWQGRSWARFLAIVLCSVNLIGALASLFSGAIVQAITGAALNVALLRLLNDDDVKAWCTE